LSAPKRSLNTARCGPVFLCVLSNVVRKVALPKLAHHSNESDLDRHDLARRRKPIMRAACEQPLPRSTLATPSGEGALEIVHDSAAAQRRVGCHEDPTVERLARLRRLPCSGDDRRRANVASYRQAPRRSRPLAHRLRHSPGEQ